MSRETGKARRSRIELGYYRRPDRLARLRGLLTLTAILVAAVFLAVESVWSGGRSAGGRVLEPSRLATKGPVARPHAMWDSDCAVCHAPFTPINASRWAPSVWAGSRAGDVRCKVCHAGPPHHASARDEDVPACAECHREHRGRDASLLAVDDSSCTSCHAELPKHRQLGAKRSTVALSVTQFDLAHHPDFTSAKAENTAARGRIKFSHARHLAPGMPLVEGSQPFTYEALAPADRARFGWKPNQSIQTRVHLSDCMPCHQLERDAPGDELGGKVGGKAPAGTSGEYMLSVTFENDCRACHALQFDRNLPDRQVRHGISPREVMAELRQFYASAAVNTDSALLRRTVPSAPVPGRPVVDDQQIEQAIALKVMTAGKLLFGPTVIEDVRNREQLSPGTRGCALCHHLKREGGDAVKAGDFASLEIEAVDTSPLWFKHARFDHTAHRALECASCHTGTLGSKVNPDPGLLPGIARCVECHAPERMVEGSSRGGAGVGCTECHRYHNGDHPGAGIGTRARRGAQRMSIEQFLRGALPQPDQ
jgi:hypothetical protein